jgi:hypothetical protein
MTSRSNPLKLSQRELETNLRTRTRNLGNALDALYARDQWIRNACATVIPADKSHLAHSQPLTWCQQQITQFIADRLTK